MNVDLKSKPTINIEIDVTEKGYTDVKIITKNHAEFNNLTFSVSAKAKSVKYEKGNI